MLTRRTLYVAALGAAVSSGARAQAYPSRRVHIVVPYPPGGQPDVAGRLLADALGEIYPQPFVVENRVGGLGMIGASHVARAAPDGHTLLVGTVASHGINPAVIPDLTYDAINDFRHVALLAQAPNVLVVHSSVPVSTFEEFVQYARERPGQLNFASPGVGTLNNLVTEMIKRELRLNIASVEYRGAGPAFNDVMAGHVQGVVTNIELAVPQLAGGRIKALAVSSTERAELLPDVPSYAELGYPTLTSTVWSGLFAPKATPDAIVNELNARCREALRGDRARSTMHSLGIVPGDMSAAEFEAFVRNEVTRLGQLVRTIGIQVPR